MGRADFCRHGFHYESLPAHESQPMASMTTPHVEAASTLAVIAASNEPLLFLATYLVVIAASASGLSNRPGERSPGDSFLISAPANGHCRNSARC